MSNIKIGFVQGDNNVIGDNNSVTNFAENNFSEKVLTRDDYFQIILDLHELERISISDYLDDKFQRLRLKNPNFVKILYKDIFKVLEGVNNSDDIDVLIENGDFAVEYGDIKLTGFPTNLHYAFVWLHLKLIDEFSTVSMSNIQIDMERFESDFLNISYDTHDYSKKLSDLNSQLKKKTKFKHKSGLSWEDLNEIFQLKPNIGGFGVDINAIITKLFNRKV